MSGAEVESRRVQVPRLPPAGAASQSAARNWQQEPHSPPQRDSGAFRGEASLRAAVRDGTDSVLFVSCGSSPTLGWLGPLQHLACDRCLLLLLPATPNSTVAVLMSFWRKDAGTFECGMGPHGTRRLPPSRLSHRAQDPLRLSRGHLRNTARMDAPA